MKQKLGKLISVWKLLHTFTRNSRRQKYIERETDYANNLYIKYPHKLPFTKNTFLTHKDHANIKDLSKDKGK